MNEGVSHTYIVPFAGVTNGEDPSRVVWRGCLLCNGVLPSFYYKEG